ncbi:hypothetical protein FOA52_016096 [Chlamydomonas sp. UWO 241]|nr:hypothetical protein FOA52_016096 [Chlamydomonas sp. UWO 241]
MGSGCSKSASLKSSGVVRHSKRDSGNGGYTRGKRDAPNEDDGYVSDSDSEEPGMRCNKDDGYKSNSDSEEPGTRRNKVCAGTLLAAAVAPHPT